MVTPFPPNDLQADDKALSHFLHLFWPVHQLNTYSGYLLGWEFADHCYFISCILNYDREEIEASLVQMQDLHSIEKGHLKILGEWRASKEQSLSAFSFSTPVQFTTNFTNLQSSSFYPSHWLRIYEDGVSQLPSLSETLYNGTLCRVLNSHVYFYDRSTLPDEFFSSDHCSPKFCFLEALSNSAKLTLAYNESSKPSRGIPFQVIIQCLNVSLLFEKQLRGILQSKVVQKYSLSGNASPALQSHAASAVASLEGKKSSHMLKRVLIRFSLLCCLLSTLAYKLIHFFPCVENFFESEYSTFLFQILQRNRHQSQWYSLIQKYHSTSYKDLWKRKAIETLLLNGALLVLIDLILGITISRYLWKHNDEIFELISQSYYRTGVGVLTSQLNWIDHIPKKFRLNQNFTDFISSIALTVAYLWDNLTTNFPSIKLILGRICASISLFGISFLIAFISDLLNILTFHVFYLYVFSARLYHGILSIFSSLSLLFRGRKWNALRGASDSNTYGTEQLLLGTIVLVVVVFLFPSVIITYITYLLYWIVIFGIQWVIRIILFTCHHFPLYLIVAHILGIQIFPHSLYFEVGFENYQQASRYSFPTAIPFEYKLQPSGKQNKQFLRNIFTKGGTVWLGLQNRFWPSTQSFKTQTRVVPSQLSILHANEIFTPAFQKNGFLKERMLMRHSTFFNSLLLYLRNHAEDAPGTLYAQPSPPCVFYLQLRSKGHSLISYFNLFFSGLSIFFRRVSFLLLLKAIFFGKRIHLNRMRRAPSYSFAYQSPKTSFDLSETKNDSSASKAEIEKNENIFITSSSQLSLISYEERVCCHLFCKLGSNEFCEIFPFLQQEFTLYNLSFLLRELTHQWY